mgnify:CR=1 FL=1
MSWKNYAKNVGLGIGFVGTGLALEALANSSIVDGNIILRAKYYLDEHLRIGIHFGKLVADYPEIILFPAGLQLAQSLYRRYRP